MKRPFRILFSEFLYCLFEWILTGDLRKYDRSKSIIEDFKANEEALQQQLCVYKEAMQRNEDKYNELKSQAMEQINK